MATNEEALRREVESLKADLMALRTDLKDLGKDLASTARAGADAAKDRVRSAVESAKEHGGDVAKHLQSTIEEKPMTSVMVAFGAGILLGAMLKR